MRWSQQSQVPAIRKLLDLWQDLGHLDYGEDVTQLAHAEQCAHFARQDKHDDAVVIAALLHDTGHLLHDAGEAIADHGIDMRHEEIGYHYLSELLPADITQPIRLHVAAKRYLSATKQGYYNSLSAASQQSLALQGGPFSDRQCQAFKNSPWYKQALLLRHYDDLGKQADCTVDSFSSYIPLLDSLFTGISSK
jgi:phosphonate degradation associated HDIG domain protein